jgi:hypothetical protein
MRAHGRKFGVKTRPQIFLAQNLIFFNGSTAFRFLQRLFDFREIRENILQRLSTFFNGFLLSPTAFCFLQWLSSTAFHFPRNPGKSIYGGKYTKDRYLSFVFQPKSRYSAIK